MPLAIKRGGGIRIGKKYNTTLDDDGSGVIGVRLYRTRIFWLVPMDDGSQQAALNTGGYNTPTTFRRMNECLAHYGFQRRVGKASFRDSNTLIIRKDATISRGP